MKTRLRKPVNVIDYLGVTTVKLSLMQHLKVLFFDKHGPVLLPNYQTEIAHGCINTQYLFTIKVNMTFYVWFLIIYLYNILNMHIIIMCDL